MTTQETVRIRLDARGVLVDGIVVGLSLTLPVVQILKNIYVPDRPAFSVHALLAAVLAATLLTLTVWALFPLTVRNDGIEWFEPFRRKQVFWGDISSVRRRRILFSSWFAVTAGATTLWIPARTFKSAPFGSAVARFAGADHLLSRAVLSDGVEAG